VYAFCNRLLLAILLLLLLALLLFAEGAGLLAAVGAQLTGSDATTCGADFGRFELLRCAVLDL